MSCCCSGLLHAVVCGLYFMCLARIVLYHCIRVRLIKGTLGVPVPIHGNLKGSFLVVFGTKRETYFSGWLFGAVVNYSVSPLSLFGG